MGGGGWLLGRHGLDNADDELEGNMGAARSLLAACLFVGGGLGCGGHTAPSTLADATARETRASATASSLSFFFTVTATTERSSTSLPACSWPASLDEPDGFVWGGAQLCIA